VLVLWGEAWLLIVLVFVGLDLGGGSLLLELPIALLVLPYGLIVRSLSRAHGSAARSRLIVAVLYAAGLMFLALIDIFVHVADVRTVFFSG
jgi:hypothetical protein